MTEQTTAVDPAGLRDRVEKALAAFLRRPARHAGQRSTRRWSRSATRSRTSCCGGGKRLRPAFAYWGVPGRRRRRLPTRSWRPLAALELVQASALIHDDVMDGSDTRRGEPAVHRRFARAARATAAGAATRTRSAQAAAILLGDLCLVWSDELLHGCGLDPAALARARPVFDADAHRGDRRASTSTCSPRPPATPRWSGPAKVARYKSAKYTVERPLLLGAAIADAHGRIRDAYSGVRAAAGRGVPAARRRPRRVRRPGPDRQAGRRRPARGQAHLPGRGRVRAGPPGAAGRVGGGLGAADLDEAGVDRLRGIIEDTGALARTEARIIELTAEALAALGAAGWRRRRRRALADLADAATQRLR